MTRFKQEARYRQARWRESRGYPAGSHPNSQRGIASGEDATIPNGSRFEPSVAETGVNFLSPQIWAAVQARIAAQQKYQTFNVARLARLKTDLLSSVPMCFNLFGELVDDSDKRHRTAEHPFPGVQPGHVETVFEWSWFDQQVLVRLRCCLKLVFLAGYTRT
jgi:hypothetical protein